MTDFIGRSLGRYRILERLGEGGMAIVYKAYDTRLERDVAIKIIRRDAFPPDQLDRILKRFEREAKALAKLSHPNVVSVLDYGEHEDSPYFVMEYLPSGTLKHRLGKSIPWQEAVRILLPVSEALEYAHEHNIIHRDIKPSNILLTEKGQPMLTDFGIAKILEVDETATLTGTGIGVGTPEYMAPEQWTGQTSPQSDIYSLGVVFYEMVTGRKPFMADTPAAILLKQATDPLPRPTVYVPNLPVEVEKILLKSLAKKASNRYLDMSALISSLEKLLGGVNSRESDSVLSQARRIKVDETEVEYETETQADTSRGTSSRVPMLPGKSRLFIGGGMLGIVVLFVVLGGYLLWNGLSDGRNPTSLPPAESNIPDSPLPTSTAYPTYTPYPTNTPFPTNPPPPRPTNPPAPLTPYFTSNASVYCWDLPAKGLDLSRTHYDFQAGATFPVLGKFVGSDDTWILVDVNAPERTRTDCCWVANEFGTLNVSLNQLKTITNPPDRLNCSSVR